MIAGHRRAHLRKNAVLATSITVLCSGAWNAEAQFEITTGVGNTGQNFDTLAISGTTNAWTNDATLAAGDSTLDGWSLFNNLLVPVPISNYRANAGETNNGSFYSFGESGSAERALGGVGSGSLSGYIAFAATNTSTATLTSFTLGFDGEQWRDGGNASLAQQTTVLEYGFGSTFDSVTWIAPGGNFNWTSTVANTTAGSVNGNTVGRVAGRGDTVGGLNWTTGQTLWIRWIELNDTGNDHGLAIDNFTFSWAGAVIASQYWDSNGSTGGIGGTGGWSASSLTWNPQANGQGAPQAFNSSGQVIFGGTPGTVTIDSAGVTANGALRFDVSGYTVAASGAGKLTLGTSAVVEVPDGVSNTNITAPISGSNGLIKSGDGSLQLSGTNDFTGTVAFNGGALRIDRPENLGNSSNDLAFAGGSLNSTATMTLGAQRSLSGSGKIDVAAGTTLTVQGDITMSSLEILGPGTFAPTGAVAEIAALTFQSAATVANTSAINLTSLKTNSTTGTVTINGPVVLAANGLRTIDVADSDAAIDLAILGDVSLAGTNNNHKLHKIGPGTLDLLGANNSGLMAVRLGTAGAPMTNGGRLIIHNNTGLGTNEFQFNNGVLEVATQLTGANAIPSTVRVSVGGGGADASSVITGSPIEFAGDLVLFNNFSTGYMNAVTLETAVTFDGLFVGTASPSAGVTLKGSGSLTLPNTGAHTVTEPILIDGPSVTLSGSLSSTAGVGIQSGRLAGSVEIAGFLTVGDAVGADDATLSPGGAGIGSISATSLVLDKDAVLELQINSSLVTPATDSLSISGLVIFGSDGNDKPKLVVTDLGNTAFSAPLALTIIDNAPGITITGSFEGLLDGSIVPIGPNQFRIEYDFGPDSNDVALVLVPEPTAISGMLLGASLLELRRRRRVAS